jgi:hypothetical protein
MHSIDIKSLPLSAAVAAALASSVSIAQSNDVVIELDADGGMIVQTDDGGTAALDSELGNPSISTGPYDLECVGFNHILSVCDNLVPKRVTQTVPVDIPLGNSGQFSGTATATSPDGTQLINGGSGAGPYDIQKGAGRMIANGIDWSGWTVTKVNLTPNDSVTAWAVCVVVEVIDQSPEPVAPE